MAKRKRSGGSKKKSGPPSRYKGSRIKSFGLPKQKKYPLNTKGRAGNAKGRAKQQLKKGRLSRSQYSQIVSRANKALKRFGAKSTKKKSGGSRKKRGK